MHVVVKFESEFDFNSREIEFPNRHEAHKHAFIASYGELDYEREYGELQDNGDDFNSAVDYD